MTDDSNAAAGRTANDVSMPRRVADLTRTEVAEILHAIRNEARDIQHLLDASRILLLDNFRPEDRNEHLFDMTLAIANSAHRLACDIGGRTDAVI